MALLLALLSALGRAWRSPGSRARHAPPSRAMEHDRAIEVYDIIRTIRDPEKPNTLEELEVVTENCVEVQEIGEDEYLVIIRHKLEIYISEGTHSTEEDINKQINDKERVAAAMENPNLREIVEQCVTEPD